MTTLTSHQAAPVQSARATPRSYRVAIVSTQPRWNGGEVQASLLACGLRERGHRCRVIARRGSEFAVRASQQGFPVTTFAGRGRSPLGFWRIRHCLHEFQPDILHYNDPHAMRAAGVAAAGMRVPVRVMARRVDFRIRSAASYRAYCDGLICVSRAVRRVCRDDGIPAARLHLVHDGVDPARALAGDRRRGRESLELADDQRLVLTVAKLTDHKGHRFLLEALPRVVRQHPRLVVALAGDGKLRDVLARMTRVLRLEDHVRFLGYRSDVPDLLAAADLFVVPSHMEGLCSSIIDAMLVGCPVIGTHAGGIPDLLCDSGGCDARYGWMVPPQDPGALRRALMEALAAPDLAHRIAQDARCRALRELTDRSMIEKTLGVYSQLMPTSSSPRP